jgi:hypothetical protein
MYCVETGVGVQMKFTTKDSGKREEYVSGMRRDTQEDKPNYDLVIPDVKWHNMLDRWAELMTRGAKKYGLRNWEKANSKEELDRFYASAFRHFMQWRSGDTDEDHAAAVFFNIQCAEFVKWRISCTQDTKSE